jgi:hypothetical protein
MMRSDMSFDAASAARFGVGGLLVLFLCWQHVSATRLGYRVAQSRKELTRVRGRVESLRLEIDQNLSPGALASQAGKRGLVPADPDALRVLSVRPDPIGWLTRLLAFAPKPVRAVFRG